MRFRTRTFIVIMAVMLCVMTCAVAYAATFTATTSPQTLSGAGYVDIKILIHNTSSSPMENMNITGNSASYQMPGVVIQPGESQELELNRVYVSEEQLGSPMLFMMTWTEGDEYKTEVLRVTVNRTESPDNTPSNTNPGESQQPSASHLLTLSYSPDRNRAEENGNVTFTYVITNVAAVTVTGITLTDSAIAKEPIVSNETLEPGQSLTKLYVYEMGGENVTAKPTLTYNGTGGQMSFTGEAIEIERVTVQIDVEVTCEDTTEEGTDFLIRITNNGNKSITGVSVKDDKGETVEDHLRLGIGETKELEYRIAPDQNREVFFVVEGELATGELFSYKTDKFPVWEYIDPTLLGVKFDIEVVESINSDGYITLEFIAENTGTLPMTELTVSEEQTGMVGTLSDIAPQESAAATFTVYAGEGRDLTFILTAKDPTGRPREYTTVILSSVFSGIDAQQTPAIDIGNINVGETVNSALVSILTVLSILTAIAGAALIVLSILERKEKERLRRKKAAARRRRLAQEGGHGEGNDGE